VAGDTPAGVIPRMKQFPLSGVFSRVRHFVRVRLAGVARVPLAAREKPLVDMGPTRFSGVAPAAGRPVRRRARWRATRPGWAAINFGHAPGPAVHAHFFRAVELENARDFPHPWLLTSSVRGGVHHRVSTLVDACDRHVRADIVGSGLRTLAASPRLERADLFMVPGFAIGRSSARSWTGQRRADRRSIGYTGGACHRDHLLAFKCLAKDMRTTSRDLPSDVHLGVCVTTMRFVSLVASVIASLIRSGALRAPIRGGAAAMR